MHTLYSSSHLEKDTKSHVAVLLNTFLMFFCFGFFCPKDTLVIISQMLEVVMVLLLVIFFMLRSCSVEWKKESLV